MKIKADIVFIRGARIIRRAVAALDKILAGRFGESFHDPKTWFGLDEPSSSLGLPGDFYSRLNRGFYGKSVRRGWILLIDLTSDLELTASSTTTGELVDALTVDDELVGFSTCAGGDDSDVINIILNDELEASSSTSGEPDDEQFAVSGA